MMHVSEPQLSFDANEFGMEDEFVNSRHECLDGFLKNKQPCFIILPAVFKIQTTNIIGGQKELLNKQEKM